MLLIGLIAAAAAQSAPPAANSDMRCLAAISMIGSGMPDEAQTSFEMAGLYYLGRVNASEPNADLQQRLSEEAEALGENVGPVVQACAEEMGRRGEELVAAGRALQAEEERQAERPGT